MSASLTATENKLKQLYSNREKEEEKNKGNIEKITNKYNDNVKTLKDDCDSKTAKIKQEYEVKIANIKKDCDAKVTKVKQDYDVKLKKVKQDYDAKVADAKKELADCLSIINPEISFYEKQKQELIEAEAKMAEIQKAIEERMSANKKKQTNESVCEE